MTDGSERGTIVVGVDGSDHSAAALKWAVEEARLRGSALAIVHAFPAMKSLATGETAHEHYRESERDAEEELAGIIADADLSGIAQVTETVKPGNAAEILIEDSAKADLIVVGSRGRGGFAGLVLGSVSAQVAQHAHCPVVVIRD